MIVSFLLAATISSFVVPCTAQVKFVKGQVGTVEKTSGSKDEPKQANLLKLNATRKEAVFRNGSNGIKMAEESATSEYLTGSTAEAITASTIPLEFLNVAVFGNISSQDYPNYDYGYQSVVWQLFSPNRQGVQIQFISLNLQTDDYIQISDENHNFLTKMNSSSRPIELLYYSQQSIFVYFYKYYYSNCPSYMNCGFVATYGFPISTDQTVAPYDSYFTSPGFPNNYQANLDDVWVFRTEDEHCQHNCVQFDFQTFNLLENDFVTVYDGEGVMASVYHAYTRNDWPGRIQASNQALTLRFTTSNNNNNYLAGFSLYYNLGLGWLVSTTFPTTGIANTVSTSGPTTTGFPFINVAVFGSISSPNYPYNYDNYDSVEWSLGAPWGFNQISLQFLAFNTEQSHDFVSIYDQYSNQLASFSGSLTPFTVTYNYNFIRIVFQSDSLNVYPGFLATYSLPITSTQDIYSGSYAFLQTPGYPGYQANLDTVWIFRSNCQPCINFAFAYFNLNDNADFLTIYNGDGVLVNSFTSHTGSNLPAPFGSNSQSITFRFTTSQASSYGGFQFYYTIYDLTTTPFPASPTPVETASTTSYIPSYRLVTASGQTNYPFGRVEVSQPYYGQWGTICSNYWSNEDAEVVCRMMGYRSGNAVGIPNSAFGQGSGNIVMNDVRCSGSENNIFQCQHNTDGYNCNHYQDASVICTDELVTNIPSTNIPMITCSGHGEPVCNCMPGYSGQHCESKIGSFCNDPVPDFPNTTTGQLCQPNGYCMETQTQAVCICYYGYSGEFCQTQNPNQLWTADRCTVYETFQTEQQNVTLGCPPNQNCIPDHISCNVVNSCEMPLGWCLPQDEYDKYMRYVNQTLKA